MTWIPGLCILGGIALVLPWFLWLEERRNNRKPVAPTRIVVSSNVVPLLRRDGVKVLPKRWGA
jgi:hypothetical protein